MNKLSAQMGLTSRTLRHWESEGLFHRDKDIKTILEIETFDSLRNIIEKQIAFLRSSNYENAVMERDIIRFLSVLEKRIYAMLASTDDIPASWTKLIKLLADNPQYTLDRSRLYLEEHIQNGKNGFLLFLFEPVKEK